MRPRGCRLCLLMLCSVCVAGTAAEQIPPDSTLVHRQRLMFTKAEPPITPRSQPDGTPSERAVMMVPRDSASERYRRGHDWILHVWVRSHGVWQVAATQVATAAPQ